MYIKIFLIILFININYINYNYIDKHISINISHFESEYERYNYFDGESVEEISRKLNRYLNSTLKNKGAFIARYSDPYLVTAIILHETGCKWNCSKIVKNCNNVGGNKGNPRCGNGRYRKFDTIEEGIKFAIRNISAYYNNGLTTSEQIGPRYAGSKTWATKINNYIKKLKNG